MAETEAEDRTQAPSKQKRQQAREAGHAAQSPELTAGCGLLGAAAVLYVGGGGLADALAAAVAGPLRGAPVVAADAAEVVAGCRRLALELARPLGLTLLGFAAAAALAHQAQTKGLWAPALLAPDPARLWTTGQGGGPAERARRGAWGLLKSALVALVAVWAVRAEWGGVGRLGQLDAPALALAAGLALRRALTVLALALVALGLLDYGLAHLRFEARLRVTPDQHREELRATDGDPALRARRRRLARAWRLDPADALAGATLLVTGPAGLTVVLAGGPPPARAAVRSIAAGAQGERLRAAAGPGLPAVHAPALAARLAGRRPADLPLTPELTAALAALWPGP